MGTAAAALMWVVNWPHFSATSYRLYRSKASARQFPMTALALPALGIPAWIPRALTGLMLLAGASLAASIAARRAKGEAWPAWPILLPAAAQLFWFVPGVSRPGYYVFARSSTTTTTTPAPPPAPPSIRCGA